MKSLYLSMFTTSFLVVSSALPVFAQGNHHHNHSAGTVTENQIPENTGQSAFAAIAEIVEILENDPDTAWNRVNITALQAHLVDMNEFMLNAAVEMIAESGSITFLVSGIGRTREAIQRMLPAHASTLEAEVGWKTASELTQAGARLKIMAAEEELAKIHSLGLWGIMTIGAHHQAHHLQIARGHQMH